MSKTERWEILPHIHTCGGRLLAREESCGSIIVRCSCCDAEAIGDAAAGRAHEKLCFCGVNTGLKKVRLRCIANPAVSSEVPDAIVAEEIPT